MTTRTVTIVFADVVGPAADGRHARLVHTAIVDHGGTVVTIGEDAVVATFDSASNAVHAALALQRGVARPPGDLAVRIGMASGDVDWDDGECTGLPVVTAARLHAQAGTGQILVAALVRSLAGERCGAEFRAMGPVTLSGLAAPVETFEVVPAPSSSRVAPVEQDGVATAAAVCEAAADHDDAWAFCFARRSYVRALLSTGEVAQAATALPALRQTADRHDYGAYRYQALLLEGVIAVIAGRFDDAERAAEDANGVGSVRLAGYDAGVYGLQMFVLRREQGRIAEVLPAMRLAIGLQPDRFAWRPGLAAALADTGRLDDARTEFDALAPRRFAAVPRDAVWPANVAFLADVCVRLGDRRRAVDLLDELDAFRGRTLLAGSAACLGPADRPRARLATLLGHRREAERSFAAALELARAAGSPTWTARIAGDRATALGSGPHPVAGTAEPPSSRPSRLPEVLTGPGRNGPVPDGLSGREVEVLCAVARGGSNREIGERLFISPNTVASHMRSILRKSGTVNRAQATAYAASHGLLDGATTTSA